MDHSSTPAPSSNQPTLPINAQFVSPTTPGGGAPTPTVPLPVPPASAYPSSTSFAPSVVLPPENSSLAPPPHVAPEFTAALPAPGHLGKSLPALPMGPHSVQPAAAQEPMQLSEPGYSYPPTHSYSAALPNPAALAQQPGNLPRQTETQAVEVGPSRLRKRARNGTAGPSALANFDRPKAATQRSKALTLQSKDVSLQRLLLHQTVREATQNLAHPRPAPGGSVGGNQAEILDLIDEEMLDEEIGSDESDEIIRSAYEEDEQDETTLESRLYRLISKMFDRYAQARLGAASGLEPNGDPARPPRVSPHPPRQPETWDQTVPYTRPAGRQPRVLRRVELTQFIRQAMMKLCRRQTRKDPLPPSPPEEIRFPTLENFGVRWEENERTLFNCLAADVVATYVRQTWSGSVALTQQEVNSLPKMVSQHIRYLCRCYKAELKPDAAITRQKRLARASACSRTHTLYENRLKVIDKFPTLLGKHRQLIVHLGTLGTSSDEEDPNERGTYLIKKHPELSSKVKALKQKLDLAYGLYFKGPGSKGSQVHRRAPSTKTSSRRLLLEGLPITCMSRGWLQTLSKPEKECFGFIPHKYDFSFPDEILQPLMQPLSAQLEELSE